MSAPGFTPRVLEFADALRREGVAIGTSEILDSLSALEQVAWTEPEPFREALAATLAKSPEDRRIFELIFERFFFRAAEAEALRRGVREGHGAEDATEDGFVSSVRALDRVLRSGDYVIPLFYTPKQWVAYWTRLKQPDTTPLFGYNVESWWSAEAK